MEARDHEAIAVAVKEREGEALIAAGVLERIEPDKPGSRERAEEIALDRRRSRRDPLDVLDDLADPVEVRREHIFERRFVAAAREALEPPTERSNSSDQADDSRREREHDDDEAADDEGQIRRDERVDIDPSVLRGGSIESTARRSPVVHRKGRCYAPAAMAKRTRYPKRTKVGPARRPTRTEAEAASTNILGAGRLVGPTPDPADEMPIRSSASLTEAEFERAERLEAELIEKERASIAASLRRTSRPDERAADGDADHNAPLSVRAAHEYAYVARDVKRIALTASLMIAILAGLYILTNVLGVITL
jgi:hypothetical protein